VLSEGLVLIDWVIIALYAGLTLFLGWHFGRRQKSTSEYFMGSGHMSPVLIGVSLFASLLSTISYLSLPGEILGKGPVYLTNYLAYPLIYLIVGFVLIPVYMRTRVTSAYELLEAKLGVSVRLLGASMFLLLRLVWMSLLIYAAARAFTYIINVDESWIPLIVAAIGAISLTYAALGGLRAVVVTDMMQTILLYGGAVLVIAIVSIEMGGFGWMPTEWQSNWDTQPIFSLDPGVRVTMVGTVLSILIWFVATSGGDQVSIQRFMATGDAVAARKAIGLQLIVAMVVGITLGFAGFAMLGYFQANPELLPAEFLLKDNADDVFPRFIAFHLPPVVSGLVVSGMLAAAMSSIDSGINSITAVVTTDFVDRFSKGPISENRHVRLAKWIAVVVGVIVVLGSSAVTIVPGNITAVAGKTVNLLTVPIFGLFFFALFVERASTKGVWIGCLSGTAVAAAVAFSGPLTGAETDPISFQWIGPAALVVNVVVGWVASLLLPDKERTD